METNMQALTHDPLEYVRGLQQLLISDKKRVGFLFGAGTSLARKNPNSKTVPAIQKMTNLVEQALSKHKQYNAALIELRDEIGSEKYNIESLLSLLEQKKAIIGKGKLNGLKLEEFLALSNEIKIEIRKIVSIHKGIILSDQIHVEFADWIGKANRKYPIEIFTTNYDYLFELGLESQLISYYDGFTGSYEPFFNSDSIEDMNFLPNQTKLWKIHGSLGWHILGSRVIRKDYDADDLLIYPSTLKYDESRKQPYMAFGDRLTNYLKQPDTILITCGYSFSDEHINERILTALRSNSTAHVYALNYDIIWNGKQKTYSLSPDTALSKIALSQSKFSVFGCRSAIIGCRFGKWKLKREPDITDAVNVNVYFDEDAPSYPSNDLKKEMKGNEVWTGEGELKIPDFKAFTDFLHSMIFKSL